MASYILPIPPRLHHRPQHLSSSIIDRNAATKSNPIQPTSTDVQGRGKITRSVWRQGAKGTKTPQVEHDAEAHAIFVTHSELGSEEKRERSVDRRTVAGGVGCRGKHGNICGNSSSGSDQAHGREVGLDQLTPHPLWAIHIHHEWIEKA